MDDLDRLFTQLVDVLAGQHPNLLNEPFQLSELYQSILPYRRYKKQLGFGCNEDYEMAVLRLFSGESGYASVEPQEVQEQLTIEAQAVNPNPGAFREFAAARVKLNDNAVRSVRGADHTYAPPAPPIAEDRSVKPEVWSEFAPPEQVVDETDDRPAAFEVIEEPAPEPAVEPVSKPAADQPDDPVPVAATKRCESCNGTLPSNRVVVYCPFCGNRVGPISCPDCGEEIDAGWRFCVTCGRNSSPE